MTNRNGLTHQTAVNDADVQAPDPLHDWIEQKKLAELLGLSEKTACCWSREGRLREFEHGFPHAGRRKYSRALVERGLRRYWQQAIRRQQEKYERRL